MLLNVLTTVLFWALFTDALAAPSNPDLNVTLLPPADAIYIGEKTYIRNEVFFPLPLYHNVTLTLYPTLDGPDFWITKITRIRLGSSLRVTGSLKPAMEGNVSRTTGKGYTCQFSLETVKLIRPPKSQADISFFVEYEAEVPEHRDNGIGAGHRHDFGATVESGINSYVIDVKHTTFRIRSLPLLFNSMEHMYGKSKNVREMEVSMRNRKLVQTQ